MCNDRSEPLATALAQRRRRVGASLWSKRCTRGGLLLLLRTAFGCERDLGSVPRPRSLQSVNTRSAQAFAPAHHLPSLSQRCTTAIHTARVFMLIRPRTCTHHPHARVTQRPRPPLRRTRPSSCSISLRADLRPQPFLTRANCTNGSARLTQTVLGRSACRSCRPLSSTVSCLSGGKGHARTQAHILVQAIGLVSFVAVHFSCSLPIEYIALCRL